MKRIALIGLALLFTVVALGQDEEDYMHISYGALDTLINQYIGQAKYREAIPLAEAMIKRATEDKFDSMLAGGINDLGNIHLRLGDYDKAKELYLQSKDIRANALGKENSEYAESLNNLGAVHWFKGEQEQALPYFLQASEVWGKVLGKEHPDYAISLNNLAALYGRLGKHPQALSIQLEVLRIREKTLGKEDEKYGNTLNNLARTLETMGDYETALQYTQQAVEILERTLGREHPQFAFTLLNLGLLQSKLGNRDQALPLYLQTNDILRRSLGPEHNRYALSLQYTGNLYLKNGDYDLALPLYLEAKDIIRKSLGEGHSQYATALNSLAFLYMEMEEYDEALPLFLQSRDIYASVLGRNHTLYGNALNNLAILYEKIEDYEQALLCFEEAEQIALEAKGFEHPSHALALKNLAAMQIKAQNYGEAWETIQQAINSSSRRQLPLTIDPAWADSIYSTKYTTYEQIENIIESLNTVDRLLEVDSSIVDSQEKQVVVSNLANALLVKVRNQISSEGDKLRLLSKGHFWLKQILQVLTPENDFNKAFGLADQSKSVLLSQATHSALAHRMGDFPDSLIWEDKNLLKKQSEIQAQLLGKLSVEEERGLIDQLNQINQEIDDFVQMVAEEFPKYYEIKYQQLDADVEDIQGLLDQNTALLEYVIGDSAVHVFYIDREHTQWSQVPVPKKDLRDRISAMHNALSNYSSDESYQNYTEQAHWLYQNLVAPALKDRAGISRLVIIPDEHLGHLPFEAFLVEAAPGQDQGYGGLHYLLNDYSISYSYSGALWKENMEAPAPRNNGQMLAMAADYGVSLDSALLAVRLPTDQWRRGELGPLPAARREVETLQEKYAGFFAFDTLASEKVAKEMAADYSILHFATHGLLDNERPVLSSLAFTEDSDSTESNFWMAHEISKAQLNADLVVLSACETGYGKFERGNGIASLARAFMYAGAPSLVVSLWQVNDVATSELMRNFYDHLDEGLDKDEALRQAKLAYLQSAPELTQHPGFWSPFIMMGKTDAIDIRKKGDGMRRVVVIGLLLLLVVGGVVWRRKARK